MIDNKNSKALKILQKVRKSIILFTTFVTAKFIDIK